MTPFDNPKLRHLRILIRTFVDVFNEANEHSTREGCLGGDVESMANTLRALGCEVEVVGIFPAKLKVTKYPTE